MNYQKLFENGGFYEYIGIREMDLVRHGSES